MLGPLVFSFCSGCTVRRRLLPPRSRRCGNATIQHRALTPSPGSALFKSLTPAFLSSVIFLILLYTLDLEEDEDQILDHPYPMGALISALTFLLAFRANFSYNRYWEAMTAVHQMHSKWLDVAIELGAFHLQADIYDKPPAFGAYPYLKSMNRERERINEPTLEEFKDQLDKVENKRSSLRQRVGSVLRRKRSRSVELPPSPPPPPKPPVKSINATAAVTTALPLWGGWFRGGRVRRRGTVKKIETANHRHAWDEDTPPLFLQELAHLLSLLSAVAMSTLRNDLEQADSPLIPFTPGAPWPHVDPDAYGADVRKDWDATTHRSWTIFKYLIGSTRTPAARTLYNAARPFRVIGGVSDAEIELLQSARGALAKVALCTMWLQEFFTREYLNGSTGKVAPPIISRLYQFVSDGNLGYNQARKIAYVPFPFPHAQITSLIVLVAVGFMPVLMLSFISNNIFGFFANLITVMCFTGLHEVARELENPFQNAPNDVPLNHFQAQFNESIMNIFFGYHPDAFWEVAEVEVEEEEIESPSANTEADPPEPVPEANPPDPLPEANEVPSEKVVTIAEPPTTSSL